MRGHKTRRAASDINIPSAAHIQARAIGRNQSSFHNVTSAVRRFFCLHDFILARLEKQRLRQFPPFGHGKTKTEEEPRLAAAGGMRRIEQVMRNLSLRHGGPFCIGQFHSITLRLGWGYRLDATSAKRGMLRGFAHGSFPMPAAFAFLTFGADDLDGHDAVSVHLDFELRDVA